MMLERCCRGLWGLMEAVVDGRGGTDYLKVQ